MLIQLLVADCNLFALAALVSEEAEDSGGDDAHHKNVAYRVVSLQNRSVRESNVISQLTEYEANDTASKVHETTEEVNHEVDHLQDEVEGKLDHLLD